MNSICLFGGGRWSRVLLNVLIKSYPQLHIIWVSKNNYLCNLEWLNAQGIKRVSLYNHENIWAHQPQAAIVATASHTHASYIKEALFRKIPVLSEKPFCLDLSEAEKLLFLSQERGVFIGVNLEFMFASYLHDFAQHLNLKKTLSSIDIVWQDPCCETRYGEKKWGDFYTPLLHDSFQHCWSLLKLLIPQDSLNIKTVSYNLDSPVLIEAELGSIQVSISLSRRAQRRARFISIDKGAIALDFAEEPGMILRGKEIIPCFWKGSRPLQAVFESFFQVIANPSLLHEWPLYIANCLDVVKLTDQATLLLKQAQNAFLREKYPFSVRDKLTRHLFIDIFLPKLAMQGEYLRVHNRAEEISFSNHIINMLERGLLQVD